MGRTKNGNKREQREQKWQQKIIEMTLYNLKMEF